MTLVVGRDSTHKSYVALWWLCAAIASAIIFVPARLPMVDLPQHAGQIGIWLGWNDPDLAYQTIYRQASLPPAFVSTALAFALAHVVSVDAALKMVIAFAVLGVPLVMRLLIREVGGNPWWAFLSFPLGFGFPFGFGFINYCLGVPVALFLVLLTVRYTSRPSGVLAASVFGTALLLFAIHAIAFGFGTLAAGGIILARSASLRKAAVALAPLLLVVPVVLFWLVSTRQTDPSARLPTEFQLGWHRLLLLPAYLISTPINSISIVLALAAFAAPFVCGARFANQPWRWILFVTAMALFFAAPHFVLGTAFIYERFAVFCLPGLLVALECSPDYGSSKNPVWLSVISPALAISLLLTLGTQFWRFNAESEGLNQVLSQIPRGARLLYFPVDRSSATSPFPVYLHSGMWHQALRGGVTDFSFARFHMNRFRYCDGAAPNLPLNFEWYPQTFDWQQNGGEEFDFFLVRSTEDSRQLLFKDAVDRVSLVNTRGVWWLFRRVPSSRGPQITAAAPTARRACVN